MKNHKQEEEKEEDGTEIDQRKEGINERGAK